MGGLEAPTDLISDILSDEQYCVKSGVVGQYA